MTALRALAHRPLAAAGVGAALLWTLLALTSWGDLFNGPRVGSPWVVYDGTQAMLFTGPVQVAPIVGTILFNLAAAIIGYGLVIRPIWGRRGLASPTWGLLAGQIPGSLLLIALARVVTLAAPHSIAPWIMALAALAGAGLISTRLLSAAPPPSGRAVWSALWPALLALGFALVMSVHLDRAHAAAEGSLWFISEVILTETHGLGTAGHWPLFSQHYDEATFLYPVVYGLVAPGENAPDTLITMWWITLAAGRVSVAALAYLAVRNLGIDRLSALALVAFAAGASMSLNPFSSRLLFDSLSPLTYALHVSRIIAPLLPLFLVSAALSAPNRATPLALAVAGALGLGLASMTIHTVIVLAWAGAMGAVVLLSPAAAARPILGRAAAAAAVIVLAAFTVTYGAGGLPGAARAGALLAGAAAAGGAMGWALLRTMRAPRGDGSPGFAALLLLGALLAGYGAGLLLFGNILIDKTFPILSNLWPWSQTEVLERYYSTLGRAAPAIEPTPYCEAGYPWMYRTINGHCASLPMFARTYGLGLVVSAFVLGWRLVRPAPLAAMPDRTATVVIWAIAACLLAQPFSFVLFDFLTAPPAGEQWVMDLSVWLRSRLIEPWFYSGVLLALAVFLREARPRERVIAQGLLLAATAVFALNPFTLPAQFASNVAYIFTAPFMQ